MRCISPPTRGMPPKQPLRLLSASELHSRITSAEERITSAEETARACRAELLRRPSHCQEPPPPQPAATSSSCMLLQLSHDEVGVVAHELCDPLLPLLAVNLGSTAKGLRVPMQAALAQLRQQHQEVEASAVILDVSITQLRYETELELGSNYGRPLTLAHWGALGILIGYGALPILNCLHIDGDVSGGKGVVLLAAGLSRRGLPSLRSLRLQSAQIGDLAACALASALTKRAMPTIQELLFCENQIGNVGIVALAPVLRQLPLLTGLTMWSNQIGDEGLAALIAQPMKRVFESLERLDLSMSCITDAGCAAFAAVLRSGALPELKEVDLRDATNEDFSPAHMDIFEARSGLVPYDE